MEMLKLQYLTNRFQRSYGAVNAVFHVRNRLCHLNLLLIFHHGSTKLFCTLRFQRGVAKHYAVVDQSPSRVRGINTGMKTLDTMSSTCVLYAELRIDSTQTFCFPFLNFSMSFATCDWPDPYPNRMMPDESPTPWPSYDAPGRQNNPSVSIVA